MPELNLLVQFIGTASSLCVSGMSGSVLFLSSKLAA